MKQFLLVLTVMLWSGFGSIAAAQDDNVAQLKAQLQAAQQISKATLAEAEQLRQRLAAALQEVEILVGQRTGHRGRALPAKGARRGLDRGNHTPERRAENGTQGDRPPGGFSGGLGEQFGLAGRTAVGRARRHPPGTGRRQDQAIDRRTGCGADGLERERDRKASDDPGGRDRQSGHRGLARALVTTAEQEITAKETAAQAAAAEATRLSEELGSGPERGGAARRRAEANQGSAGNRRRPSQSTSRRRTPLSKRPWRRRKRKSRS